MKIKTSKFEKKNRKKDGEKPLKKEENCRKIDDKTVEFDDKNVIKTKS